MAIKNVASSPVTNPGLGKSKEVEGTAKGSAAAQSAGSVAVSGPSNKDFGVQLSDSARQRANEQKKAFDIAKNTPDVREDKVAAIKAKLQAGTYEIDSGKIADGMLREAIMEHLATDKDS